MMNIGRIFMKFRIWIFIRKIVENIPVSLKYDKNNGYFTWRPLDGFSWNFVFEYLFENLSKIFQYHWYLTRIWVLYVNNTGRIFMKFCIWVFVRKFVENIPDHLNLTRLTGTLHEDQCGFLIISRSVLLRMRNISHKIGREHQNTHFMFNKIFV